MSNFSTVWKRIQQHQGELFHTKRGCPFKYSVKGNYLKTTRTDYALSKKDFETVYNMLPIGNLAEITNIVRGPSYIWAILNDKRI
jgi:hypothetical protein